MMKNVFYHSAIDDDLCSACYKRELQPREPCSRCGRVADVCARPDGVNGYCNRCYLRELLLGQCSICRTRKPIAIRFRGKPVCAACYRREFQTREECSRCGTFARVQVRVDGTKPICDRCYTQRFRPRESCARCGQVDLVETRNAREEPICPTCYRKTIQTANCTYCSRLSRVMTRTKSGKPVCSTCYARHHPPPAETCALCGERAVIKRRLPSGRGACQRCYLRELAPRPKCSICSEHRIMAIRIQGKAICTACRRRKAIRGIPPTSARPVTLRRPG
ncbi:MAG TPA: hypothetical protein VNO21_03985 [Polyangiaceae bacterium]|nr:hypothetical protein [Polyangiaceae bacterium]